MKNNFGIDIGLKNIKTSLRNKEGKIKSSKINSLLLISTKDSFLFEGKRYKIDKNINHNSNGVIKLEKYSDLEKYSPIFIWNFIKENNINIEDINYLSIGLSFAYLKEADSFLKRISKFKIDNLDIDLTKKIILIPQGVGAKYTIERIYKNIPKNYLIIDIGLYNLDIIKVINNNVNPNNIIIKEGFGTIKLLRNIQEFIYIKLKKQINIFEANDILLKNDKDLIDLEKMMEEYSNYLYDFLEILLKNKYQKIFFVGGGAYYMKKINEKMEILKKSEYSNSIGNLIKAEEI